MGGGTIHRSDAVWKYVNYAVTITCI